MFVKPPALPENFAENVLDLEIKIDQGKFTIAHVDSLVYLYSQAIEHFEHIDRDKHLIFYQRTQRLLNKPQVHKIMKEKRDLESGKLDKPDRNYFDQKFDFDAARQKAVSGSTSFYTPSRKKLEMDVLLMQDEHKEGDKNYKILEKHQKQVNLKSELVESDILTQKRNLELRLLKRKIKQKSKTRKSMNFQMIGFKDSFYDEFSSIIAKPNAGKDESWTEENNSILKEIDSTKDKTDEEPIFESFDCKD